MGAAVDGRNEPRLDGLLLHFGRGLQAAISRQIQEQRCVGAAWTGGGLKNVAARVHQSVRKVAWESDAPVCPGFMRQPVGFRADGLRREPGSVSKRTECRSDI